MKITVGGKCSDMAWFNVTKDGVPVIDHHGYMPSIKSIGGDDYIELDIDNETGKIIGWVPLTDASIEDLKDELGIEDED